MREKGEGYIRRKEEGWKEKGIEVVQNPSSRKEREIKIESDKIMSTRMRVKNTSMMRSGLHFTSTKLVSRIHKICHLLQKVFIAL